MDAISGKSRLLGAFRHSALTLDALGLIVPGPACFIVCFSPVSPTYAIDIVGGAALGDSDMALKASDEDGQGRVEKLREG